MLIKRLSDAYDTIDISSAQVYCGLHTIKLSIRIPWKPKNWGNLERYYQVLVQPDGSVLIRGKLKHKLWPVRRKLRLAYNRDSWLVIIAEPEGEFPDECTDLLPFYHWHDYIEGLITEFDEVFDYGRLDLHRARLSRFDFSVDIVCKQYSELRKSLGALPVQTRLMNNVTYSAHSVKYATKTSKEKPIPAKSLSVYERQTKSGGYDVMRLKFRNQKSEIVDTALGFRNGRSAMALDLSDRDRVTEYARKTFHKYGIYVGSTIMPLRVAQLQVENDSVRSGLMHYHEWSPCKQRYYINRARDIEHIAVGSFEYDASVVTGLYKSIWSAFNRALGDQHSNGATS